MDHLHILAGCSAISHLNTEASQKWLKAWFGQLLPQANDKSLSSSTQLPPSWEVKGECFEMQTPQEGGWPYPLASGKISIRNFLFTSTALSEEGMLLGLQGKVKARHWEMRGFGRCEDFHVLTTP